MNVSEQKPLNSQTPCNVSSLLLCSIMSNKSKLSITPSFLRLSWRGNSEGKKGLWVKGSYFSLHHSFYKSEQGRSGDTLHGDLWNSALYLSHSWNHPWRESSAAYSRIVEWICADVPGQNWECTVKIWREFHFYLTPSRFFIWLWHSRLNFKTEII